ncbi:MAG TPA: right-handed parallel beta-helix repeat-containing protein [Gammaproteobacteria bacterium]
MQYIKSFILVAISVLNSSLAYAETYYVSPTGSASWSQCAQAAGGISTPCNGRTAVENAVAGDLVYFLGGTYNPAANPIQSWANTSNANKWEVLPWNPSNSGTTTAPITFKAYPGQTPVFLDNIYSGALGAVGRDNIIWDGFSGTIVDAPGEVIVFAYFRDTNNCIIRNSNFTGILKGTHNNSALISLLNNSNILIENNRLHGMNMDPNGTEEANNSTAILSYNSRNMIVRNNDIWDNYFGIFDKDIEQNNSYYRNHIWGGNSTSTACRVGIQIHEQEVYFGASSNTQAYQNVIRDCRIGAQIMDNTSLRNNGTKIFNNVIFNSLSSDETGIFINTESYDAEVYNNIIDGYDIPMRYFAPMSTRVAYSDNNLFFNGASMRWWTGFSSSYSSLDSWQTASTFDTHSLQINPEYIGTAGSTNPYDYRLSPTSPAIGMGRDGVNIGAYPSSTSLGIGYNPVRPKSPLLHP